MFIWVVEVQWLLCGSIVRKLGDQQTPVSSQGLRPGLLSSGVKKGAWQLPLLLREAFPEPFRAWDNSSLVCARSGVACRPSTGQCRSRVGCFAPFMSPGVFLFPLPSPPPPPPSPLFTPPFYRLTLCKPRLVSNPRSSSPNLSAARSRKMLPGSA